MESKQQQTLRRLKSLSNKNKSFLESLTSHLVLQQDIIPQPQWHNFSQMKQQYELILNASKESIQRNAKLQHQLDNKQYQLQFLLQKQQKHVTLLQNLDEQIIKVTGEMKKQRKSMKQMKKAVKNHEELKQQLLRLNKLKKSLQKQENDLTKKEEEHVLLRVKLQNELTLKNQTNQNQQDNWQRKIECLQQELDHQKLSLQSLREWSSKTSTPIAKNRSSKKLQDLQLMIRRQMEQDLN